MSGRSAAAVRRRPLAYTLRAGAALVLLTFTGCEWFTDFKRQPSISTWEQIGDSTVASRTNPLLSVPVTGMIVAGYQVSYAPLPAVIDSMAGLANPVAADARSLQNGHRYYQINCAVCHGDAGAGDGAASRYGMPGINIVTEITRARTDGYIWGMIRNGRGLMPNYNRIPEQDRWDVVNYVRALQSGATGVATGAIAAPGVTGTALPGASQIAPTRPPPYWGHPGRAEGAAPAGEDASQRADTTAGQSPAADAPATPPARPGATAAPARTPGAGTLPDTGGRP
ncbi:MAG TPA: cytochrome c [Gemmatimonadaceae bacterium]